MSAMKMRRIFVKDILFFGIILSSVGISSQQVIKTGLHEVSYAVGDVAYLTVTIDSSVEDEGVWMKDGQVLSRIPGKLLLTKSTGFRQLVIYNVQLSDAGQYTLTIAGEISQARLTVTDTQLRVVTPLVETRYTIGGTINLVTRLSSTGISNGEWYKDGVLVISDSRRVISVDGTDQKLTIVNARSSDTGLYQYRLDGLQTAAYVSENTGPVPINGTWSNWGQWTDISSCPATCGTSATNFRERDRQCNNPAPQNGGQSCVGTRTQTESFQCGTNPCLVDGGWSEWGNWGSVNCPVTCGDSVQGPRDRHRTCTNPSPQNGGRNCSGSGSDTEITACTNISPCPNPVFQQVLSDSEKNTGELITIFVQTRQSGVSGTWYKDNVVVSSSDRVSIQTSGTFHVLQISNLQLSDQGRYNFTVNGESTSMFLTVAGSGIINGQWSNWGQWTNISTCPATCGTSAAITRRRDRQCNNPAPQNGGQFCVGLGTQTESFQCGTNPCLVDGVWSEWGNWGSVICPVTCGVSVQGPRIRHRTCTNPSPQNGGRNCPGSGSDTEMSACTNISPCAGPINGQWSNWGQWTNFSTCPATCGTSAAITRRRDRQCNNPAPKNGGQFCVGSGTQTESFQCGTNPCLVDGAWSEWGNWGSAICSVTCGDSVQGPRTRHRTCTNPSPQNGGRNCPGSGSETEMSACTSISPCAGPINGQWSNWGEWTNISSCPATCGASAAITRKRDRQCNNPAPQNGGQSCVGTGRQTESFQCGTNPCIPDGGWSEWGNWGNVICPVTCGVSVQGTRNRHRTCTNPSPQNGGRNCSGFSSDTEMSACINISPCSNFEQSLSDTAARPGGLVVLNVTTTQSGLTGTWYKNDQMLSSSDRVQIQSSGAVHTLTIRDLQFSDAGRYNFTVNGETTSAYLTVSASGGNDWSNWGSWGSPICSVTCGSSVIGVRRRTRTCTNTQSGGCVGPSFEEENAPCGFQPCSYFEQSLSDTTARPGGLVVLNVTTTQSGLTGTWYKNNQMLSSSDRVQIQSSGAVHTLTIRDLQVSDKGRYNFTVNGETTSAYLTVSDAIDGGLSEWSQWANHSCSATCGSGVRNVTRDRTCSNPVPSNEGNLCTEHLYETMIRQCELKACAGSTVERFIADQDRWLIAAIGAAIAIGVVLIIFIIACCIWQCRQNDPKPVQSPLGSTWEVDDRNGSEYVTRGKYNDPSLNGSVYK